MGKQNNDPACSTIVVLAGLGFVIYLVHQAVLFFQRPDAVNTVLEPIKGLGICVGLVVLTLAGIAVYFRFFAREPDTTVLWLSREYSVRCYLIDLDRATLGSIQANRPEEPSREAMCPVYLLFSITNFGPSLETCSIQDAWQCTEADNAARFSRLSGGHPDPIILPWSSFHLYYVLYRQEGDRTVEVKPPNADGYTDPIADLPAGTQAKIVITYTAILEMGKPKQIIAWEQPLKLQLVAMDNVGHDDPVATCALYNIVWEQLHPPESEEDDSWMYRSRPTIWPWY